MKGHNWHKSTTEIPEFYYSDSAYNVIGKGIESNAVLNLGDRNSK